MHLAAISQWSVIIKSLTVTAFLAIMNNYCAKMYWLPFYFYRLCASLQGSEVKALRGLEATVLKSYGQYIQTGCIMSYQKFRKEWICRKHFCVTLTSFLSLNSRIYLGHYQKDCFALFFKLFFHQWFVGMPTCKIVMYAICEQTWMIEHWGRLHWVHWYFSAWDTFVQNRPKTFAFAKQTVFHGNILHFV